MASAAPQRQAPPKPAPAHVPAAAPPQAVAPPMAAPSQGPGIMGQIATTAAGVAIGHTMGHAITGMFSGGSSSEAAAAPQQQAGAPIQQQSSFVPEQTQEQGQGPCAWEVKQFLQCAQQQSDLSLCEGFNEAIRQCKSQHHI